MKMYNQTKDLKEAGANAGLPKRSIRVSHDRKFVGRHRTNRGTMVNLYEIHGSTAWIERFRCEGLVVTMEHLNAIAKQGYDVSYWVEDSGRITAWYERSEWDYNEAGEWVQKAGTVTDVRKQAERTQKYIDSLNIADEEEG